MSIIIRPVLILYQTSFLTHPCLINHRTFVLKVSSHSDRQLYHQAIHHPAWQEAMKTELDALELNNTWSIVTLPVGKYAIR